MHGQIQLQTAFNMAQKVEWMCYILEYGIQMTPRISDTEFRDDGRGVEIKLTPEGLLTLGGEMLDDANSPSVFNYYTKLASTYEDVMLNAAYLLNAGIRDRHVTRTYTRAITGYYCSVPHPIAPEAEVPGYRSNYKLRSAILKTDPITAIKRITEKGYKIDARTAFNDESGQYCIWCKRETDRGPIFVDVCRHLIVCLDEEYMSTVNNDLLAAFQ